MDAFKDFLFDYRDMVKGVAEAFLELLGDVWSAFVDWLVRSVPEKNWRKADLWVANLTLFLFFGSYAHRFATRAVGFGDWVNSLSFDAPKMAETYSSILLFRVAWGVVGPWLGGFIALIMVFPEFLGRLAIEAPRFIWDLVEAHLRFLVALVNAFVVQVIKMQIRFIQSLVREFTRPLEAILKLLEKIKKLVDKVNPF